MSIYCVTHKPVNLPESTDLNLIQVGDSEADIAPLRDNKGDHIAEKNETYSELTALYYIWKNQPTDIVGFCHYRRFLLPPGIQGLNEAAPLKPFVECQTEGDGKGNYASGRMVEHDSLTKLFEGGDDLQSRFGQLLQNHSIVLPVRNELPEGDMIYQYTTSHPASSIFALLQVLSERDHYLGKAAYEYFRSAGHAHWNNLFVTKWPIFDQYCSFLFDILFELESRLNLPVCTYQRRVFAFLSERLLNFWVWFNELSVAEVEWCLIEEQYVNDHEAHHNNPATQQIFNADWRKNKRLIKNQIGLCDADWNKRVIERCDAGEPI